MNVKYLICILFLLNTGCSNKTDNRYLLEKITELSFKIYNLESKIELQEKKLSSINYSDITEGAVIDLTSHNIQHITPTLSVGQISAKDQAGGIILSGIIINHSSTLLRNLKLYFYISGERKDIDILNNIKPSESSKWSIFIPNFKITEENKLSTMYFENAVYGFN